jgi:Ran GTPase-activating protein (RanGAP) involved in mRNA processing and transport
MLLKGLECPVSKLVNSDTCPRPMTGLPPLPLLIKRRESEVIKLNNFNLGDALGIAYADGLRHLQKQGVRVRELHIANCFLGQTAVAAMMNAVASFPGLELLDLTDNGIGANGAASLQVALAAHETLADVRLAKTKIDDRAAGRLFKHLIAHASLTSLDLSSNDIAATPAMYKPLANVLEAEGQLRTLNLGWNRIDAKALSGIAEALQSNTKLTHLDLSWNGFGNKGALVLGSILRFNAGLKYLNICHNEIRGRGCFVIADTLKENKTLDTIIFDGNPLGIRGGRAILRALRWMIAFGITGRNMQFRWVFIPPIF